MLTVIDYGNGRIETWLEVDHHEGTASITVWGASGDDVHGRERRGYGKTRTAAVLSLLEILESAGAEDRAREPYRTAVVSGAAEAMQFFRRTGPFAEGSEYAPTPYPDAAAPKELTSEFWRCVDHGLKIQAIKALRAISGLSLKSAKDIVDRITTAQTPLYELDASSAPVGTVLRSTSPGRVWVVQKAGADAWEFIGYSGTNTDKYIQERAAHGHQVLYTPKETN